MGLRFTKMHGLGNDYVYVDLFRERLDDPSSLARRISDRRFGVGSDGLILIRPPESSENDCRMEMYNADGSRAEMCGNGIRCVAKYAYDRGIARRKTLRIETDAGVKTVEVHPGSDGRAREVTVNMGAPRLKRREIPMNDGGNPETPAILVPVEVAGRGFRLTAVNMGNPHAVVRIDDPEAPQALPPLDRLPLEEWGPLFENHPWFPRRTNTEFIAIRSPHEIDFRVWERGSGETLACGTGACAAAVAAVINGWCTNEVVVHLKGGDLKIRWEGSTPGDEGPGDVFMTGPAAHVFDGELSPEVEW